MFTAEQTEIFLLQRCKGLKSEIVHLRILQNVWFCLRFLILWIAVEQFFVYNTRKVTMFMRSCKHRESPLLLRSHLSNCTAEHRRDRHS